MWVDVREAGAVQGLQSLEGEGLNDVDMLATAVVTLTGIAFGILVRGHRTLRLKYRHRGEVLRRDHLKGSFLPVTFGVQRGRDLRVDFGERGVENLAHPAAAPVSATYASASMRSVC